MSTKIIRSITDFSRFRMDIDVLCYCGHTATLPFRPVVAHFIAKGWPRHLGSAYLRFRCKKCGSRPRHIGPIPR